MRVAAVAHHIAFDEQRRERSTAHREQRVDQNSGEEVRAVGTRHAHRAAHVEAQEPEQQERSANRCDLQYALFARREFKQLEGTDGRVIVIVSTRRASGPGD